MYVCKRSSIPISPLTLNEGSDPKANIEPLGLDFLYEFDQIVSATEVVLSLYEKAKNGN